MTTRDDVTVTYTTSPRIAEVDAPSIEITMQDLVDTLRKDEDAFSKGLSFQKLVNASGKEDLGGGVLVGITVALQDTKLAFEGRTTPAETGTVTTGSGPPVVGTINFIDIAADFVTAGIERGSLVINYTDQSIADVVEIVSLNELRTKILVNGISNTYTIGDVYDVFNIIQCNATGGNLTAVDDLQATTKQILPTAFTQVVITASSSATLQEQLDIQHAVFNGGVTIDVIGGVAGTTFPTGTSRQPVNNVVDAVAIAGINGLSQIFILGDLTLDTGDNVPSFIIHGQATSMTNLIVNPGADVTDTQFRNLTLSGTLDGTASMIGCHIGTLSIFNGDVVNCLLETGVITLSGGGHTSFLDCWDGTAGISQPIIDLGGTGQALIVRNYPGGLEIRNKTGPEDVSISGIGIRVVINDTVTNGEIVLRGTGKWGNKDTYVGGATVIDELVDGVQIKDIHGQMSREIYVDQEVLVNGNGYQQSPFNNFTDAVDFAEANALPHLVLKTDSIVDRQLKNFVIRGLRFPTLDLNNQNMDKSSVQELTITGTHLGAILVEDAGVNNVNGEILAQRVAIGGTYTLRGGSFSIMSEVNPLFPGTPWTLDLGLADTASVIGVSNASGDIVVTNMDVVGDMVAFHMSQGTLLIDASCTAGTIEVTGDVEITDNSTGATVITSAVTSHTIWNRIATDHLAAGTTGLMLNQIKADTTQLSLDTATILALATILEKHQTNRTLIDSIAKTLTVFDNDGITPLQVFDLKNVAGAPSTDSVFERVPQ